MENLFEAIPYINAYKPTFLVLGALALVVLIQSFLTAPLAFAKEEQTPGMPLQFDHSKLSFRAIRTYQNSAESFPAFLAAVLVAVAAGASPLVVNPYPGSISSHASCSGHFTMAGLAGSQVVRAQLRSSRASWPIS